MRINLVDSHSDIFPKPLDLDWDALVEFLRVPLDVDPEGLLPGWIPAHLENQQRGTQFARTLGVLVLDYDELRVADWQTALENLQGVEHCYHSTRSHRPVDGAMAYRVVVRLSREVDAAYWKDFYKESAKAFGGKNDGKTCDPSRLFYRPVATPHFEFGHAQGQPWPVEDVFTHLGGLVRAANPATREGLERLVERGKNSSDFDVLGHKTWQRLLSSETEEYAEPGQRDNALFAAAVWIAKRSKPMDVQSIVDICMPRLILHECRHADGRTFAAKLERAFEEQAATLKSADPVEMCQLNREGPYSEEEIQRYLGEQSCTSIAALRKQMLITHRSNVYVFSKGDYIYAGTRDSGELLATQELRLASTLGVELVAQGPAGSKDVPFKTLLKHSGAAVRNVRPSLAIKTSYVDWTTSTLMHSICPRRLDLVPAFDEDIQRWLESWGDETLLDWLATAPRLEKATAALFLHSAPEMGKTMLAQGLATIWGNAPTEMESIRENFNDELTQCPVVFADETMPDRFRKDSGLLRRLITATQVSLNRKYMETSKLHGSFRVIIAKNNMTLFAPNESMSREDVEAVAGRILYYRLTEKSPFFHPVRLAQHILWLEATRSVTVGENDRLWVKGRDSAMHRHMRISSRDRSLVCQWIMEMLMQPTPVRDSPHTTLSLRQGVAVSPLLIYRRWETYLSKERQLDLRQIVQVLGEIGMKDSRGMYSISTDDLRQWADAHSYPTDIDNLVAMAHTTVTRSAN